MRGQAVKQGRVAMATWSDHVKIVAVSTDLCFMSIDQRLPHLILLDCNGQMICKMKNPSDSWILVFRSSLPNLMNTEQNLWPVKTLTFFLKKNQTKTKQNCNHVKKVDMTICLTSSFPKYHKNHLWNRKHFNTYKAKIVVKWFQIICTSVVPIPRLESTHQSVAEICPYFLAVTDKQFGKDLAKTVACENVLNIMMKSNIVATLIRLTLNISISSPWDLSWYHQHSWVTIPLPLWQCHRHFWFTLMDEHFCFCLGIS